MRVMTSLGQENELGSLSHGKTLASRDVSSSEFFFPPNTVKLRIERGRSQVLMIPSVVPRITSFPS